MKILSLCLAILGAILSTGAQAAPGPSLLALGLLESGRPSAFGGELGAALLFQPFEDHEFMVGPRVAYLVAFGDQVTRMDLNIGGEGTLWLVNAFGPGLALDLVAPSQITGENASVHFKIEPNLAVRLKRVGDFGALALRLGVPFDSHYMFGLQAGITLQFNGVPGFTEPAPNSD